jgi:TrmH family RNA methyltransferase
VGAELSIVLVRPLRAANVGAAARAMKNFGHRDLRLVAPGDLLADEARRGEARALAWNAADVLDGAQTLATLPEALADLHLTAAATSRVEPGRDAATPREWAEEVARLPAGSRAGCVFGPEDSGLTNDELDRCRVRLRIPTRAEQPSLNLAQAVVVVAYETASASVAGHAPPRDDEPPAAEGDVERLCAAARDVLLRAGYLNPQAPEHVLGELRRLLARSRPSSREVTLLLGLVAQLDWALRQDPR